MLEHLRLFFLYLHTVLTASLYWTKLDVIQISTLEEDFESTSRQFDILLAFGLLCNLVKGIAYGFSYHRVTLSIVLHCMCDIIASFFLFWIVLDGWSWQSYIVILVFCG